MLPDGECAGLHPRDDGRRLVDYRHVDPEGAEALVPAFADGRPHDLDVVERQAGPVQSPIGDEPVWVDPIFLETEPLSFEVGIVLEGATLDELGKRDEVLRA